MQIIRWPALFGSELEFFRLRGQRQRGRDLLPDCQSHHLAPEPRSAGLDERLPSDHSACVLHLWMVDRHHRLRALLEMVPTITTYGYVIDDLTTSTREEALQALHNKGWLYLQDGRGMARGQRKTCPPHCLAFRMILTAALFGN